MANADAPGPDPPERNPSTASLRALDGLNVFLADVRDGMGPFLGTFLRENHHGDAGRAGIALAASQIGTVLAQTPAGALIDRIKWKRLAVAAALAGGATYLLGYGAMFVLVAAMAAAGAAAILLIREGDIDHDLARGAVGIAEPFKDRRITIFAASVVLFPLANAAMLPRVGQKSSDGLKDRAAILMSACIIAAQAVMVPVALGASRLAERWAASRSS
jgi:MFS family permease